MKIYNPTGFSSSLTGSFSGSIKGTLETTGHLVPSENEAYDLGSDTKRFRDIYLSGSTIYLGAKTLSEDTLVNTDSLQETLSSYVKTTQNNTFLGTQFFDNIAVDGTGSFAYINSVTGSAKMIGDAFIILNADTPAERYAGIKVYDSGSNDTGSLEYDSINNHWFYESTTEGYASGLISGPRDTRGAITFPTNNTVVKGIGGNHIDDSNITDNGSLISLDSTLYVTGSNVGIGISDPSSSLHLYQNQDEPTALKIENVNNSISASTELNLVSSGNNFTIKNYSDGDTTNANRTDLGTTVNGGYLTFSTSGGNERIRVTPAGSVGIGTETPNSRLEVFTTANLNTTFKTSNVAVYNKYESASGVLGYIGTANAIITGGGATDFGFRSENVFVFANGLSEAMRIDSNGKLGLGTTSPSEKLEVNGTIKGTLLDAPIKETRAGTGLSFWQGTQAQYDALGSYDSNTIYLVT